MAESPASPEKISIDEFKKAEIRIGEIRSAGNVEGSQKLLRLEVLFGNDELRQIVSGVAAYFPDPQMLVGRRVAFAYNLEPRTLMGLESDGMILAATDEAGNFSLLETVGVAAGAQIR